MKVISNGGQSNSVCVRSNWSKRFPIPAQQERSVTNCCVPECLSEQIIEQPAEENQKLTLSQKLEFRSKRLMNAFIGWSYYNKQAYSR